MPIIFATYPVIAGIEDADFLFNVVFVITLLSLDIQGTTITAAAHKLDLATEEPKTGNDFGIELPDELESQLSELTLTEESLADGNRLQDMHFPKGTLVMMVKQFTTLYLGVGKAFAPFVLYVVERPVILPLISKSSIGVFFVKQFHHLIFFAFRKSIMSSQKSLRLTPLPA